MSLRRSLSVIVAITLLCVTRLVSGEVSLLPLCPRIFVAQDTFYGGENSLVYVGDAEVTVIGATWTPETARLLSEAVARVTPLPIRNVINTNFHPDRCGGNAFWVAQKCTIHATKLTDELLREKGSAVAASTRRGFPDFPDAPVTLPNSLHDGDFELEQGAIRALFLGPSHTPDGIFVYLPKEKILYGGCILKPQLGNLSYANLTEYPKTLEKLKALHLEISTIVAGHGTPVHGPELIDHFLSLLKEAGEPKTTK